MFYYRNIIYVGIVRFDVSSSLGDKSSASSDMSHISSASFGIQII